MLSILKKFGDSRGVAMGCAKGAQAHSLEKKWLEVSTGPTSFSAGAPPPSENSWLRS